MITEWFERYEVNEKGHPAKPGDKLRKGRLDYIRSKVHGRSQSAGFAAMQSVAGEYAYEVFGLFHKFLEIKGHAEAEKRSGPLLNARNEPATIEDLAFICRWPVERVRHALAVLCHPRVEWMFVLNSHQESSELLDTIDSRKFPEFPEGSEQGLGCPDSHFPGIPRKNGILPKIGDPEQKNGIDCPSPHFPGIPGRFLNTTQHNTRYTIHTHSKGKRAEAFELKPTGMGGNDQVSYALQDCIDACVMVGIPKPNAQSYYDHYNSQGWKKANSQPITSLRSHMVKRWDRAAQCWDFDRSQSNGFRREATKANQSPNHNQTKAVSGTQRKRISDQDFGDDLLDPCAED